MKCSTKLCGIATAIVLVTSSASAGEWDHMFTPTGMSTPGIEQFLPVLPDSKNCPIGGRDKCMHVALWYTGSLAIRVLAEELGASPFEARVVSAVAGTIVAFAKEGVDGVCQTVDGKCHMTSEDLIASLVGVALAQILPWEVSTSPRPDAMRQTYFDTYEAPLAGEGTIFWSSSDDGFQSSPQTIARMARQNGGVYAVVNSW